jgi:aminoglycoside/choline kinase family phosphotransferase
VVERTLGQRSSLSPPGFQETVCNYEKKLLEVVPDFFPSWYVSLRESYSFFTRARSAFNFDFASSSSTESMRSARDLAVKNLFLRLYSGLAARASSVSPGEGT